MRRKIDDLAKKTFRVPSKAKQQTPNDRYRESHKGDIN